MRIGKGHTEKDHGADTGSVDHEVTHQEPGILEREAVLDADITGDSQRKTRRWVKGELHNEYGLARCCFLREVIGTASEPMTVSWGEGGGRARTTHVFFVSVSTILYIGGTLEGR